MRAGSGSAAPRRLWLDCQAARGGGSGADAVSATTTWPELHGPNLGPAGPMALSLRVEVVVAYVLHHGAGGDLSLLPHPVCTRRWRWRKSSRWLCYCRSLVCFCWCIRLATGYGYGGCSLPCGCGTVGSCLQLFLSSPSGLTMFAMVRRRR
jgi:hypothetical protein